jgi:hypothetical protein
MVSSERSKDRDWRLETRDWRLGFQPGEFVLSKERYAIIKPLVSSVFRGRFTD